MTMSLIRRTRMIDVFWLTAVFFLVNALIERQILDLSIGDTYYVLSTRQVNLFLAFLFFLFSLLYWLFQKTNFKLRLDLTWWHYGLNLLSCWIFLRFADIIYCEQNGIDLHSQSDSMEKYQYQTFAAEWMILVMCIFSIGQLFFLYNIFQAFAESRKKRQL